MNRRAYLRTSSLSLGGLLTLGPWQTLSALAADNRYRKTIGIQLYTLRGPLLWNMQRTLDAVVEAGYQQGELFGFPKSGPLIQAARDAGLQLNSSHIDWTCITNPSDAALSDFQKMLAQANDSSISHLVIPYLHPQERKDLDAYRRLADHCNQAASIAQQAGIQLAYHNHAFEFEPLEGSTSGYDILIERFTPEMQFEVDVFWVAVAGLDPVSFLRSLKGRVSQLHLKDLKAPGPLPIYGSMPKQAFKELGNGSIPMEPIIKTAADIGVVHCHVEQDHSPDPMASIRQSMAYLKSL